LDKGLLGLLPLPVLGILFLLLRRWQPVRLLVNPAGVILFLTITLPWFLFMYWRFGWTFVSINFVQQTLNRYVTSDLGVRPFYFYVGVLVVETLPWSLFMLPALAHWGKWLRRQWREIPKLEVPAGLLLLPLVWFAFAFLFFSASLGKRAVYVVVLYPAAALLIGHYFAAQHWTQGAIVERLHRLVTALLAAACLVGPPVGLLVYRQLEIYTALIWLPVGLLAALGLGLCWLLIKGEFSQQAHTLALAGFGLILGIALLSPKLDYYHPLPRFAQVVSQRADAAAEVGTFQVDTPSLMFYARRKIFQCFDAEEMVRRLGSAREVFFVTRSDHVPKLQARTANTLEIIDSQPMLELKWRSFFGRRGEALNLVLVRKPRSVDAGSAR